MSNEEFQLCPICFAQQAAVRRYPHYLCKECVALAKDESGRQLQFFNEGFSGGFVAKYVDTGESRNSHACFVNGVQCWADEARFGGIVLQPKP
jgi:hypothetical protein